MEKTIAAFEARRQFGKMIREVETQGDSYVVERHGEPVAAVVPLHIYLNAKRKKERLFELIEEAQANAQRNAPDMTDDEVMELALEAVAWARDERRKERLEER